MLKAQNSVERMLNQPSEAIKSGNACGQKPIQPLVHSLVHRDFNYIITNFPPWNPSPVPQSFPSEFNAILTSMKLKDVLQTFLIELWCLSLRTLTIFLSYHIRGWALLMNETETTPHHGCAASPGQLHGVPLPLVPGGLISASNTVSSCQSRNINESCLYSDGIRVHCALVTTRALYSWSNRNGF